MDDAVVIVGGGPAGLAVAACLQRSGVHARILDRAGVTGGAYREMPDAMELASPSALNGLPGLALAARGPRMTAAEYRDYLERYARHHGLVAERADVRHITRARDGFSVQRDSGEPLACRAVVVATGLWSHPVTPDLPLAPPIEVMHSRAWRGAAAHPQPHVLIVGGGMSAVETAVELALAGRRVWLSSRRPVKLVPHEVLGIDLHHWLLPIERLPTFFVRRFCTRAHTFEAADLGYSRLVRAGRIEVRGPVTGSFGHTVHFARGAPADVDLAVLATGYTFATPFLPPEVRRLPTGQPMTKRCESVSWPGLFVVGMRCACGIDSEFLRGVARDAERVAQRLSRSLSRDAA